MSDRAPDSVVAIENEPGLAIGRSWVQDWVQLNEGRMAFPIRKRRQIGQLAFLLLWPRTRRSGVRVLPGAPLSPFFSLTYKSAFSPALTMVSYVLPLVMVEVREYLDRGGRSPYASWSDRLNREAAAKVAAALARIQQAICPTLRVSGPVFMSSD